MSTSSVKRSLSLFCVFSLFVLLAATAHGQQKLKNLKSLGTDNHGVGSSTALAINSKGQVCGDSEYYDTNGNDLGQRAFLYDPVADKMINLGTLGTPPPGYDGSAARGINNNGQVCGFSVYFDEKGKYLGERAFLYDLIANKMINLGTLGMNVPSNHDSYAAGINDKGQVCGYSEYYDENIGYYAFKAFLYDPILGMINLGTLGGKKDFGESRAYAINDIGQMCGVSDTPYSTRAFLYDPVLGMINLGTLDTTLLGYHESGAFGKAINAKGQVCGVSIYSPENEFFGSEKAFLYDPVLGMISLGTLGTDNHGYGHTGAIAINDKGQVCGYSEYYDTNGNDLGQRAFLYDPIANKMINLGTLGTDKNGVGSSGAIAINAKGQVCGSSEYYDKNGKDLGQRAFLYDPATGTMTNLGSLGTDKNGVGSSSAYAINDKGQVCGTSEYYDANGKDLGTRAFVYDPECSPDSPTYTGDTPDPNVALGIGHDWTFRAEVSKDQGVIIHDAMLRSRYMAEQISLPYFQAIIKDSNGNVIFKQNGKLTWDSNADTMRCRLVDLHWGYEQTSDDTIPKLTADQGASSFVLEAHYVVDRFDPSSSYMCIFQRYEFRDAVAGDAGEPTGSFPVARFFPVVKYDFHGAEGETMQFNSVERCHFEDSGQSSNVAALFKDQLSASSPVTVVPANNNPLQQEGLFHALINGGEGEADNIHQTFENFVDPPKYPFTPGCPECVHIHWKWSYFAA